MSTAKVATAVTRQVQKTRQIPAVVISAGLMQKTVKVRIGTQQWNSHIRKQFSRPTRLLVHDPRSSLREGDIVSISPGWRASKHVHHVVNSIIAPFGPPIEARLPVPSEEERLREREEKQRRKEERRGRGRRRGSAVGEAGEADEAVVGKRGRGNQAVLDGEVVEGGSDAEG